jgi:hypothetical protein
MRWGLTATAEDADALADGMLDQMKETAWELGLRLGEWLLRLKPPGGAP